MHESLEQKVATTVRNLSDREFINYIMCDRRHDFFAVEGALRLEAVLDAVEQGKPHGTNS